MIMKTKVKYLTPFEDNELDVEIRPGVFREV